jgi:lipid-A-disaccharide synthase
MTPPQILFSAGEASGEMYAAQLAAALRRRADVRLFGLGGLRMREAGVELVADCSEIAVVGVTEVLGKAPTVWRILRKLTDEAAERRPRVAILVDSPAFHLRLARRLRPLGVRNVYFVAPQVWAWRPWRVNLIRRRFERVLCIFPFEEQFYREAGVPADFVGHPLVDLVKPRNAPGQLAAAFAKKFRLDFDASRPMVALLPGSRSGELAHNLPTMLEACQRIERDFPCQFVLAVAPGLRIEQVAEYLRDGLKVHLVEDATYDALAAASVAIVASGTATVEAALIGTPMVVVYRVSAPTAFVLRRLVRAPYFGMVNLIAGRRVVLELFQGDFTPERVSQEVLRLLSSPEARSAIKRDLDEVRCRLGTSGAVERAAKMIAGML